jgi:hypothetical protein
MKPWTVKKILSNKYPYQYIEYEEVIKKPPKKIKFDVNYIPDVQMKFTKELNDDKNFDFNYDDILYHSFQESEIPKLKEPIKPKIVTFDDQNDDNLFTDFSSLDETIPNTDNTLYHFPQPPPLPKKTQPLPPKNARPSLPQNTQPVRRSTRKSKPPIRLTTVLVDGKEKQVDGRIINGEMRFFEYNETTREYDKILDPGSVTEYRARVVSEKSQFI